MKFVFFRKTKQFIKNKKKALIICGMALLLVVTGVVNYKLNTSTNLDDTTPTNAVTANFFDTYKQDRDASRESQLELLNEISNNAYATEIERSTALQNKAELQKKMEKELILEGLIKAKGFDDAVVTIGSEYYNVIVKGGQLTQDQATQILGVITNETKTSPSNVKIIPVE
jgi:stage III sporulation protein AH